MRSVSRAISRSGPCDCSNAVCADRWTDLSRRTSQFSQATKAVQQPAADWRQPTKAMRWLSTPSKTRSAAVNICGCLFLALARFASSQGACGRPSLRQRTIVWRPPRLGGPSSSARSAIERGRLRGSFFRQASRASPSCRGTSVVQSRKSSIVAAVPRGALPSSLRRPERVDRRAFATIRSHRQKGRWRRWAEFHGKPVPVRGCCKLPAKVAVGNAFVRTNNRTNARLGQANAAVGQEQDVFRPDVAVDQAGRLHRSQLLGHRPRDF